MSLLKCDNVSLAYDGITVVRKLSFEVNKTDYLCIVGENGSGKSTIIKALLGLMPIESGSISFGDGLKQNEIGYLPQRSAIQKDFPAKVSEVVLSGCLNSSSPLSFFYTKEQKKKAEESMAKLAITDIKNTSFRELSGGQQQRVLLARALCATKSLLLLDEPMTGLDPVVTNDFYKLIKTLNVEGTTVIMVTHDIKCAVDNSTHILHLRHEPLFFGKTTDYVQTEVGQHFIGISHHH